MTAIVNQVNQIIGVNQGGSTLTSTAAASTGTGAPLYGQCGGIGWTGPTTCAVGICTPYNIYFAQCLL